jgi:hypothetical protein
MSVSVITGIIAAVLLVLYLMRRRSRLNSSED